MVKSVRKSETETFEIVGRFHRFEDIVGKRVYVPIGETGASPPCFFFFSTRLERAICMLEDSTVHTCKVCTLATFHSIYMNLGLYMNRAEIILKTSENYFQSE